MSDEGTSARAAPGGRPPHPQAAWNAPPPSGAQLRPAVPGRAPASPFASPYAPAPRGSFVEAPAPRSSVPGIIALVAAVLATVAASAIGAVAAYRVGLGTNRTDFETAPAITGLDFLSPVRDWVLLGEVSFWIGTALGVWAVVQGILAIATRRGRTAGVVAVAVAAIGPAVFLSSCAIAVSLGLDAVSGMTA